MILTDFFSELSKIAGINNNISKEDALFISHLMISLSDQYHEYSKEFQNLLDNTKEAISDECNKYYYSAANNYIKIYEEIKDKVSYSKKNETKKFFEKKISKMKYNYALEDYNDKNYSWAIDKFKEYIDDEYMTNDIKLECRVKLANSLLFNGEEYVNYHDYYNADLAIPYFEEALNIINSYWQVKNKFCYLNRLKTKLAKSYEHIAKNKWSNYDINSMESTIDYLKKVENLNVGCLLIKNFKLYYYLYKAYNESKSYRTSNLDMARKFEENGINVSDIYYKSRHINDLQNSIEQKQNNIRNLNYELNSVNNNINNIQSKIYAKNSAISNKNTTITELINLTNSLVTKGNEINTETNQIINEGKNQVEQVAKNIKDKKDFVEELNKLEGQKKKDIENMKNNNKMLKQKNEQLIQVLTTLELKLN